jgi:peroxin-10
LHTGNAARSTFSVATWILRLHLAQYLVTGKYPTILHRLLGVQHEQQTTTSRVHLRPDSHRLIALLIGIQASATLTRHLVNWWTRKVASYLESKTAPPSLTRRQLFPKNTTATTMNHHSQSSSTSTCAICRTERSHPAAPASCGHVFCWNCLLQWVSTVRAQCPLCRAPCRPQDIVPLYHYDHHGHLPP